MKCNTLVAVNAHSLYMLWYPKLGNNFFFFFQGITTTVINCYGYAWIAS
jgi:hypothetical protein